MMHIDEIEYRWLADQASLKSIRFWSLQVGNPKLICEIELGFRVYRLGIQDLYWFWNNNFIE